MSHELANQAGDIIGPQPALTAVQQRRERTEQPANGAARTGHRRAQPLAHDPDPKSHVRVKCKAVFRKTMRKQWFFAAHQSLNPQPLSWISGLSRARIVLTL